MLNKLLLFTIIAVFANAAFSQVTTEPSIAVDNQSVKIIFNASEGTGGLADYTGDVYAHTGVITNLSSSTSDWKYVIADWTENIEKAKMTRSSENANIYELEISPDIRTFYSVPEGEEIQKMAFVFRSADQSKEGKADGGNDIIVDVTKEGLTVSFINPNKNIIIKKNETLDIDVSVTVSADIELISNAEVLKSETGTSLSYSFSKETAGNYWLFANATSGVEVAKDSVHITVREETIAESQPGDTKKGINYISDTEVILSLFAPEKESVFVIGDFNDWLPLNNYQMKKDGDTFWLTINNLESGKPYVFQYLIDESLKIADPYTDQVSDPWNDQYIESAVYPNLPIYPEGKTTGIASVLQTGQTPYQWEITDFQAPDKNELIIYELLIRDFDSDHSYRNVIDRLNYLEDLNINVLELMPVNEFEGNSSWGYNPSFYFAPDKYYGTKNDLKKLIDECHKRGIAVVIDMVLNHSYGQSPFVRMYWDVSNNQPAVNNPWYNETSNFQNPDAQWGYDFNHDSEFTRELMDSINSYWMNEYKVDGFRFDFTKGFSNTSYGPTSWGSTYDGSRIANLKRMADEIWQRNEDAIVIFEHLADNSEEKELADYGIMLWGNMNHNYGEAAMGYVQSTNSDLSWGVFHQRGWIEPNLVTYMESHDEERLTYKLLQYGNASGDYNTKTLSTATDRMELNNVFFIPLPGPKMIWQFGELAYDFSIDYNGRLGEKPIKWDYTEVKDRTDLFQVVSKLNYLKQTYEEFQNPEFTYSLTGETKWYQLKQGDNYVLAFGNFGVAENSVTFTFPKTGTWYDYFNEAAVDISSAEKQITLAPGKYLLYSTREFDQPYILTENRTLMRSDDIKIYPNPAKDFVWVESDIPIKTVSIYSMDGRLVKQQYFTKSNENKIALSALKHGHYIILSQTEENFKKINLIKY